MSSRDLGAQAPQCMPRKRSLSDELVQSTVAQACKEDAEELKFRNLDHHTSETNPIVSIKDVVSISRFELYAFKKQATTSTSSTSSTSSTTTTKKAKDSRLVLVVNAEKASSSSSSSNPESVSFEARLELPDLKALGIHRYVSMEGDQMPDDMAKIVQHAQAVCGLTATQFRAKVRLAVRHVNAVCARNYYLHKLIVIMMAFKPLISFELVLTLFKIDYIANGMGYDELQFMRTWHALAVVVGVMLVANDSVNLAQAVHHASTDDCDHVCGEMPRMVLTHLAMRNTINRDRLRVLFAALNKENQCVDLGSLARMAVLAFNDAVVAETSKRVDAGVDDGVDDVFDASPAAVFGASPSAADVFDASPADVFGSIAAKIAPGALFDASPAVGLFGASPAAAGWFDASPAAGLFDASHAAGVDAGSGAPGVLLDLGHDSDSS